jgi:hypothetical protein
MAELLIRGRFLSKMLNRVRDLGDGKRKMEERGKDGILGGLAGEITKPDRETLNFGYSEIDHLDRSRIIWNVKNADIISSAAQRSVGETP